MYEYPDVYLQTHLSENHEEISSLDLFPECKIISTYTIGMTF